MNFNTLSLTQAMLAQLQQLGYTSMTPIQQEALPAILEGRDIVAKAKTGSGKTAAFGIGLLHKLNVKKFRVQSLVLCPTRELAQQVAQELRAIAKFQHNIKILMLTGGESFYKQANSLAHEAHIVVGTPGRVLKHLNKETLNLQNIETFVLDEADRMLDMGFMEEVEAIMKFLPTTCQRLLFSATYDVAVQDVIEKILDNPLFIEMSEVEEVPNEIEEIFYQTQQKEQALVAVISSYKAKNTIVFTNTKIKAQELSEYLVANKIDALALHGDLEQYERNDVLVQFSNGSTPVLIATDVAARGLDIKELAMVVNYDLPHTKETYKHRIGRTARAGAKGIAVTFFTQDEREGALEYMQEGAVLKQLDTLKREEHFSLKPEFVTLVIEGGKKSKLRAGDILGALTGSKKLKGEDIGKIDIYEKQSYVAVKRERAEDAYAELKQRPIKKKKFSVWML
jgi:ATP-independent RNA helicase DbpA